MDSARAAARQALVRGPSEVALRDQAKLALPEHFGFIPRKEAAALMTAMGNSVNEVRRERQCYESAGCLNYLVKL